MDLELKSSLERCSTKAGLESTIDTSYKAVFGVTFKERANVTLDSEEVLDVPTWIRRGR